MHSRLSKLLGYTNNLPLQAKMKKYVENAKIVQKPNNWYGKFITESFVKPY
jgi:hypothetical protein